MGIQGNNQHIFFIASFSRKSEQKSFFQPAKSPIWDA